MKRFLALIFLLLIIILVSCAQIEVPKLPSQIAGPIGKAINIYPNWASRDNIQLSVSSNTASVGDIINIAAKSSFTLSSYYILEGSSWKKQGFICSNKKGDWCLGQASSSYKIPSSLTDYLVIISYSCDTTTTCNNDKWLMQIVNIVDKNKADLEVVEIDINPKIANSKSSVHLTIKNNGKATVNKFNMILQGLTRVSDSQQDPEEEIIRTIKAKEKATIILDKYASFPIAGDYLITATIDSQNTVDEFDEQNNQLAKKITIN